MKLSTINWLSKAIALPLFATIFQILPASAEQIQRAPRISLETSRTSPLEFLPSPTDLNLKPPIPASTIAPENREPSNSIGPIWANPDRRRAVKIPVKRPVTIKLTLQRKDRSNPNLKSSTAPITARSNRIKSDSNRQNSVAQKIETTMPTVVSDNAQPKPNRARRIAAISSPPFSGNYLKLVRDASKGTNNVGNPIYTLEAYVNGQKLQTFDVVSGTKNSQGFDRNQGDNAAPLPDGLYSVSGQIIPGSASEVGKTFIGIFPKFETRRNSLGIHLDPSFNKTNGYDGTAGCIGMATPEDRDAINDFVTKYQPRNLSVNISSPQD